MNRKNNRKNDDIRAVKITKDFTKNALSSILIEFGNTKIIVTASVDEQQPKWMGKDDNRGWISAEYSLLPTSTNTRCSRERSKLSGRTQEIQRLIGRSLRACVDLEKLGQRTIIIDADVIQADGSTRCTSICGGFLALKDAINKLMAQGILSENPIKDTIAAVSVGILNNEVFVDLDYEEDFQAEVDSNIVMTQNGKIIEFQMTAEEKAFTQEQLITTMSLASKSIDKIISCYYNV